MQIAVYFNSITTRSHKLLKLLPPKSLIIWWTKLLIFLHIQACKYWLLKLENQKRQTNEKYQSPYKLKRHKTASTDYWIIPVSTSSGPILTNSFHWPYSFCIKLGNCVVSLHSQQKRKHFRKSQTTFNIRISAVKTYHSPKQTCKSHYLRANFFSTVHGRNFRHDSQSSCSFQIKNAWEELYCFPHDNPKSIIHFCQSGVFHTRYKPNCKGRGTHLVKCPSGSLQEWSGMLSLNKCLLKTDDRRVNGPGAAVLL